MNAASVITLIIIVAIVIFVIIHMWKNRGKSCCGCGRTDCPSRKGKKD